MSDCEGDKAMKPSMKRVNKLIAKRAIAHAEGLDALAKVLLEHHYAEIGSKEEVLEVLRGAYRR